MVDIRASQTGRQSNYQARGYRLKTGIVGQSFDAIDREVKIITQGRSPSQKTTGWLEETAYHKLFSCR